MRFTASDRRAQTYLQRSEFESNELVFAGSLVLPAGSVLALSREEILANAS